MPQTIETTVQGFAHCRDARCDGYSQQPVQIHRTLQEHFYTDSGGDLPGTERSFVYLAFADPEDVPCPACGEDREASEQARPSYQPLTPYGQKGLLTVPKFDPGKRVEDTRVSELEAKLEEQGAQVAALLAKLDEKAG